MCYYLHCEHVNNSIFIKKLDLFCYYTSMYEKSLLFIPLQVAFDVWQYTFGVSQNGAPKRPQRTVRASALYDTLWRLASY